MIESERIKQLNNLIISTKAEFVLYFVQSSPRVKYNYALSYAILQANKLNKPLIVVFELNNNFSSVNKRNFTFLIQGLNNFKKNLQKLGVPLIIVDNKQELIKIANNSAQVITDKGYLTFHKERDSFLVKNIGVQLIQVESNVVVPLELVSNKQEYGAYTIRPKIQKHLDSFLITHRAPKLNNINANTKFRSIDISNIKKLIENFKIDSSVEETQFVGGEEEAEKHLDIFINNKLSKYEENRNNANLDFNSNLSPYLHFGHISPVLVALKCLEIKSIEDKNVQSFFNELIIWRELAKNYCYYNKDYDNFSGLPNWVIKNFDTTQKDKRDFIYNLEKFENAKTHDLLWNSAQIQMLKTGKMHGVMRMYWGKKIIEWTKNPEKAHKIMVYLNDKYSLDGRDENGYAGIGWCFGLHDKPFFRHKVMGIVRFMAESGIKKKFDINEYIQKHSI